ncbi:hypothetical protein [Streptomyces sp. NPDC087307]|uniref:hypothetical protein n=1 Tax=Streptomyces sp. NPDC087307 TaxID=3365782 RepID=UPI003804D235
MLQDLVQEMAQSLAQEIPGVGRPGGLWTCGEEERPEVQPVRQPAAGRQPAVTSVLFSGLPHEGVAMET